MLQSSRGEGNAPATFTEEDMAELRQKTRAVEEVGMKIDESIRVCQDTEALITRLGRFDQTLFSEMKTKKQTDAALKKLVHQTTLQLEKFPRKNRHSQEWFEKYNQKYLELKTKSENCDETVDCIQSLLKEVDLHKQKALEKTFKNLNELFGETFTQIVP